MMQIQVQRRSNTPRRAAERLSRSVFSTKIKLGQHRPRVFTCANESKFHRHTMYTCQPGKTYRRYNQKMKMMMMMMMKTEKAGIIVEISPPPSLVCSSLLFSSACSTPPTKLVQFKQNGRLSNQTPSNRDRCWHANCTDSVKLMYLSLLWLLNTEWRRKEKKACNTQGTVHRRQFGKCSEK